MRKADGDFAVFNPRMCVEVGDGGSLKCARYSDARININTSKSFTMIGCKQRCVFRTQIAY